VEPDDLLYGHLIALAGRCRKLEVCTKQGCVFVLQVVSTAASRPSFSSRLLLLGVGQVLLHRRACTQLKLLLTDVCVMLLLQVAFDLIEDMRASGLKPSTPTCSALMYACLQNNNFAAARKVGDAGVLPWGRQCADRLLMQIAVLLCAALMYAYLQNNNFAAARKVGGVQTRGRTRVCGSACACCISACEQQQSLPLVHTCA
jgi:hypothetical protein